MELLLAILFIGFLGLFIGSFLHVVADRMISGESILFGRSHCDNCQNVLSWKELVPVVSFVIQNGRCKECKKVFSYWYPLSEVGTGIVFVLMFLTVSPYSFPIQLLYFFLVSVLIVIFLVDAKYGLIPLSLVGIAFFISLILMVVQGRLDIIYLLVSGGIIGGIFLAIFAVTRGKGMGFGDVVYAFFMGSLLGLPKSLLALYVAFLTGATVALILVLAGRKKLRGGTIAFGPFLIIGTIVALFWGDIVLSYVAYFL